jgi:HK97 family phage portal protein
MKLPARIKSALSALRGQPLDGYPFSAVSADPWQFWQRGLDINAKRSTTVAAVESAIDAYVHAIAQMYPSHYRMKDDGGKERITTSALSRRLRIPNRYQTWSDFTTFQVRQLLGTGNFYAAAIRNDRNEIESLHPLFSQNTRPLVEKDSGSLFYVVRSHEMAPWNLDAHVVPSRDILHIRLHTPNHPLEGVSPITYAAMAIASNSAISSHQAAFFNNMSRPSFILSTDAIMNGAQMKQLRDAWTAQSTMLETGGVPILANGLKAQPLSLTSQDAQLVEAFKMTIEDIARAFRVPGPLLGLTGTYSNTEQMISFWLSTGLGYMVNHIEQAYDKFFDLPAGDFTELDTDTLLRVDLKSRLDSLSQATQNGIMSPNEARSRLDLPKVEFGDEPRMQAQCVPLSNAQLVPAAPAAPAAPVSDAAPAPIADQTEGADTKPEKAYDMDVIRALAASAMRKMREPA